MKYIEAGPRDGDRPTLELTRRNLEGLLAKLDDPSSVRCLIDPDYRIMVMAVENEEHYADREPGPMVVQGEWI